MRRPCAGRVAGVKGAGAPRCSRRWRSRSGCRSGMHGRLAGLTVEELSVLDLGCGECASAVSRQVLEIPCRHLVSVDVHEPALTSLRSKPCTAGAHTLLHVSMQDVGGLVELIRPDVTLFIDSLEHLEMAAAVSLLEMVERYTRQRVVIWLPLGNCPQEEYGGNPFQRHLSTWTTELLTERGYEVERFPGFHLHFEPPVDAGWAVRRC